MKKALILLIIVLIALSGCGQQVPTGPSVDSLLAENDQLLAEVKATTEKLNEANSIISKISGDEKEPTLISYIDTSETNKTFNTFKDKIFLPVPITYPESEQSSGVGYVSLVQNIEIYPSQNWSTKISGTTVELYHSSGIQATFKVTSAKIPIPAEEITEKVMMPVINAIPNTNVKHSTLFLEEYPRGSVASFETNIDSKEATMRIICINIGETVIIGDSLYLEKKSDVNEEIIDTLLRSMKVFNQKVTFN